MHHNIEIAVGVMGQPKPCPFGSGLKKFALDFVVVIFFKDAEKNFCT